LLTADGFNQDLQATLSVAKRTAHFSGVTLATERSHARVMVHCHPLVDYLAGQKAINPA
jgi:hypothetical protein